jgi:hypothetical protein
MSYTKVIIILVAVLSFFSALIAIAGLGLMSAEDYATREQVAYESLEEPQDYDPDKFALDANRGELRKEYFGIKLADLEQDENGNFIMNEQQRETFVKNILGKHMCSLQWISWKQFGSVTISQDSDTGIVFVKGGQKSKTNSDYLDIDGTLTIVNPLHLKFEGEIITCVDYINNGKLVKRKGTYNFTVAGQRRYWRMQEMTNPDDGCCDYVDIYFD